MGMTQFQGLTNIFFSIKFDNAQVPISNRTEHYENIYFRKLSLSIELITNYLLKFLHSFWRFSAKRKKVNDIKFSLKNLSFNINILLLFHQMVFEIDIKM